MSQSVGDSGFKDNFVDIIETNDATLQRGFVKQDLSHVYTQANDLLTVANSLFVKIRAHDTKMLAPCIPKVEKLCLTMTEGVSFIHACKETATAESLDQANTRLEVMYANFDEFRETGIQEIVENLLSDNEDSQANT